MKSLNRIFIRLAFALLAFVGGLASAFAQQDIYLSFEQRFVISALLDMGTSSVERKAQLLLELQKISAKSATPQVINVRSFPEFIAAWRGSWPESHLLSVDLDLILQKSPQLNRQFKANTPELQAQINEYIRTQPAMILKTLGPYVAGAIPLLAGSFDAQKTPDVTQVFDSMNEKLQGIVATMAEKAFANSEDPFLKLGMKTIFTRYYTELSTSTTVRLASSLLSLPVNADMMDVFGVVLQNSGPKVQKLLQIVARLDSIDPEMAELFKVLEKNVKPVPLELVHQIINSQKQFKVISIEEKPLGVGTMAQVHRAVIQLNGRKINVVIRFLKPGIGNRVEEDARVLKIIAAEVDVNPEFLVYRVPKLVPLMDEISNAVRAELIIANTIENQDKATEIYSHTAKVKSESGRKITLKFQAPKVYIPQGNEHVLHVQELVKGESLAHVIEKYKHSIPDLGAKIAEETTRLWIQEALFGSGFYHADLHQGNFLINGRGSNFTVSIMDYGMSGQVNKKTQQLILGLIGGLRLQKENVIASAFYGLSNKKMNKVSYQTLKKAIRQEIKNIEAGRSQPRSMLEWTGYVVDQGLALSFDIINLNRGVAGLDALLQSTNSKETLSTIAVGIGAKNPGFVFGSLRNSRLGLMDMIRLGLSDDNLTSRKSPPTAPESTTPESCKNVF